MLGFIKKVEVADNERVLMFKHRQFEKVLTPGFYRFVDMSKVSAHKPAPINYLLATRQSLLFTHAGEESWKPANLMS